VHLGLRWGRLRHLHSGGCRRAENLLSANLPSTSLGLGAACARIAHREERCRKQFARERRARDSSWKTLAQQSLASKGPSAEPGLLFRRGLRGEPRRMTRRRWARADARGLARPLFPTRPKRARSSTRTFRIVPEACRQSLQLSVQTHEASATVADSRIPHHPWSEPDIRDRLPAQDLPPPRIGYLRPFSIAPTHVGRTRKW
jgi:hypothetical protein